MKQLRSFSLILGVMIIQNLNAQWSIRSSQNNPISTAANSQEQPRITSDGDGGAIIVWKDTRGESPDIYAQRISAVGIVQWSSDGVGISMAPSHQQAPVIVSDGTGGAIIAWVDIRANNPDIYVQRINASGEVQWTVDGVAISTTLSEQIRPVLASDGAGGAIIAWNDNWSGTDDVYAQRINASGEVLWTVDGVPISTVTNYQYSPVIQSDGAGGAIIVWPDNRNGTYDIYAQRINASGEVLWTVDGVAISTGVGEQLSPALASDGTGGTIIVWNDSRGGAYDIYAQRINASGVGQWAANGVPISTVANDQFSPVIVSDGAGGAMIAWHDRRNAYDLYAQHIDASGVAQWLADGIAISTASTAQSVPVIVSDGTGGAIIAWHDDRIGTYDIYAQRVNTSGIVQWTIDGAAITTAGRDQYYPAIVSDGAGGAIIAWDDYRNVINDIYAQRIDRQGNLGYYAPTTTRVLDVPSDQGGLVDVLWSGSAIDTWPNQTVTSYVLWRGISGPSLPTGARIVDRASAAIDRSSFAPFVAMQSPTTPTIYWQMVDSVPSHWLTGYSYAYSTPSDSGTLGIPWTYFMITAATDDPLVFWDSLPDSGYSVDNLSPAPPSNPLLTPLSEGQIQVQWQRNTIDPDVGVYAVYRSTSAGFPIVPANRLGTITDTAYIDVTTTIGNTYFYRVTTIDIHGNESPPTAELSHVVTTVEDVSVQPRIFMLGNYPNPFNPTTNIPFSFPEDGMAVLMVYDVSGRKIATLFDGPVQAGRLYNASFDATGLSSGTYLVRLIFGGKERAHKMLFSK